MCSSKAVDWTARVPAVVCKQSINVAHTFVVLLKVCDDMARFLEESTTEMTDLETLGIVLHTSKD